MTESNQLTIDSEVGVLVGNPAMPDIYRLITGRYQGAMQEALELNDQTKAPAYFTIEHAGLIRSADELESAAGTIFAPNEIIGGGNFWVIRPAQAVVLIDLASVHNVTEEFREVYTRRLGFYAVPDMAGLRSKIVPPEVEQRKFEYTPRES